MEGVNLIGGFAQYCVSRRACLSMPCLVVEEEEAFFPDGSVQVSFTLQMTLLIPDLSPSRYKWYV